MFRLHQRPGAHQGANVGVQVRSKIGILDEHSGFKVCGQGAVREVRRADERAAAVDDDDLGVQQRSGYPPVSWPSPASNSVNRTERPRVCPGTVAGAVLLGLEDDVDPTAALTSCLKVSGQLGKGVGREADEQDALARVGDELVQDGAVRRCSPAAPGPVQTGETVACRRRAVLADRCATPTRRRCQ
jgi:hypothetical protein